MAGKPITFVLNGVDQPAGMARTRGAAESGLSAYLPKRGELKHSVRLVAQQRGEETKTRISAIPGEDVVVLHIAGGPALVLHPENARDLLLAQSKATRTRGEAEHEERSLTEVEVPLNLRWTGLENAAPARMATRGMLGDVLVSAIEVFTGVAKSSAATFAAKEIVKLVDDQVVPGVYEMPRGALPESLKGSGFIRDSLPDPKEKPTVLVLVHGTFSNTVGTFGKLWLEHPALVQQLFDEYRGAVYALEHETLGKSPIANALELAKRCPNGTRLHLLTHSRGGLVAEVMAKVCGDPHSTDDLGIFEGAEHLRHRDDLAELRKLVDKKGIKVDRVVRVACPARGTLLASKRLDAYLSVFRWGLELAHVPIAPYLVEFIGEVAQHRANPDEIPGLAAQIPDGPLVQWLHRAAQTIHGELRVVAGDLEGDSVVSWLKTLLADAFYWTDNDLVVQTSSMYGGAPRAAGATFVLDQGGAVSHFNYFSNDRTAKAVVSALVEIAPQGFRAIGPLSWKGESSTGVRGAEEATNAAAKPAVFLLPGILGSNLKVGDKRVWLSWRIVGGLEKLRYDPAALPKAIVADGPIESTYHRLSAFLSQTHEVVEFAFDWRKPMEEAAADLAKKIAEALDARRDTKQPVRLLAHSMGGLVARTMQLVEPDIWDRMMKVEGARFVMLGTPNAGSWAPMTVLSGDDDIGNLLVTFGLPFQDHKARDLMAQMPGFLQLQAGLLDPAAPRDLGRQATWQKLADDDLDAVRQHNWWHTDPSQLNEYKWGVPKQAVLDSAVKLRDRLDKQAREVIGRYTDQMALVVGHATFTPDGYDMESDGLVYLHAQDGGDGRVPLHNALITGVKTWKLDCEHGNLPDKEEAFTAYLELLEKGDTERAPLTRSSEIRGEAPAPSTRLALRPSRAPKVRMPPESERQAIASDAERPARAPDAAAAGAALDIAVVNGDLMFIEQPLMIGHYRSTRLTGTEAVMNRLLGKEMERELRKGNYPVQIGTKEVFMNAHADAANPWRRIPRPQAVVVVGLGEEGKLRHSDLVTCAMQGVLAWSKRIAEASNRPAPRFELAATLIGSGGTGFTAGDSAQLITQGVREANLRLAREGSPTVGRLILVELYLDRATEAWRALKVQAQAMPSRYRVAEVMAIGEGALTRPLDAGYRGADYDFISASTREDKDGRTGVSYTLDTRRARSEVRDQMTQLKLVQQLVASAATDRNTDLQIGRTLFNLLVPPVMEAFLGGTTEMVLEVDDGTAGIPWELLDTDTGADTDNRPWSIRSKLVRKLKTANFREVVVDAGADALVLVVGEPQCDDPRYPRLPAARAEARAVAAKLSGSGGVDGSLVRTLISPDDERQPGPNARAVINALNSAKWRIVHISGHGRIGKPGEPSGILLSDGDVLSATEIGSIRWVPELVFVNCCHLAAFDPNRLLRGEMAFDPAAFAAGVAEALINLGVRCVVAAGWAVEDESANTFATVFYDSILRGERFIEAVAHARESAYTPRNNTWAAYQCYGDPEWVFQREGRDAQRPPQPPGDEFAGVASPRGLELALETLEVRSNYQDVDIAAQEARIRYLEAKFESKWGKKGQIAEAFAQTWAATGGRRNAVEWYERAVVSNAASIRSLEQLGNLRARVAWEAVRAQPVKAVAAKALEDIARSIDDLKELAAVQPSVERESVIGSAYKRRAMVNAQMGGPDVASIKAARKYYRMAEQRAAEQRKSNFFYPALNRVACDLVLDAARPDARPLGRAIVRAIEANLDELADNLDFWSAAARIELELYKTLAVRTLSRGEARARLEAEFRDLRARVSSPLMWGSVIDQMEFVLPSYALQAPAEKRAADELLAFLRKLVVKP